MLLEDRAQVARRMAIAKPLFAVRRVASEMLRLPTAMLSGPARRSHQGLLVVLVVATLSCTFRLGATKLWDRDEPRNASCAREMLERNDWVVPVFNGELRTHKPILLYWLTMAAYALLGVHEFSARLPSALLGIGTCVLTWAIGKRLFSDTVGVIAGCALATSLMFVVASRAATPDATLIFWMTAALAIYVHGAFPARSDHEPHRHGSVTPFPRRASWIGFYTALAFAVLAKGPVGLLLPTAAIGMFLLIATNPSPRHLSGPDSAGPASLAAHWWRCLQSVAAWFEPRHFLMTTWRMHVLTAVVVVAMVALPWYAWVGWRTGGEWLRGFFLEHNFGRATQAMEGHRGSAVWFYPAAILVGFFPWSLFALPVLVDLRRQLRTTLSPAICLLLCWIAVIVMAFSLAKTKLPSYVTPTYPALALLTAHFLERWSHGVVRLSARWMKLVYLTSAVVGLALLIGLTWVGDRELPGESALALLGLVPLVLAAAGWWCVSKHPRRLASLHVAAALAMVLLGFGWGAVRISRHQNYEVLLRAFPPSSDTPVAALACLEPSWVFYSGRVVYEVDFPDPGNDRLPRSTERQLVSPVGQRVWYRPRPPINQFFSRWPEARVVLTEDGWRKLGSWTSRLEVVAETTRFLRHERLYVVQLRQPAVPDRAAAAR